MNYPITKATQVLTRAMKRLNQATQLIANTDIELQRIQDQAATLEGRQQLLKRCRTMSMPRTKLQYLTVRHKQAAKSIKTAIKYLAKFHPDIATAEKRRRAGYLTIQEMAQLLKISHPALFRGIRTGFVLAPSHTIDNGVRKYFRVEEKHDVMAGFNKRIDNRWLHAKRTASGLLSILDVCRQLNVSNIVVGHHIKKGRIKKPTHKFTSSNGRTLPYVYYTQKEADQICEWYREWKEQPENNQTGRPKKRH